MFILYSGDIWNWNEINIIQILYFVFKITYIYFITSAKFSFQWPFAQVNKRSLSYILLTSPHSFTNLPHTHSFTYIHEIVTNRNMNGIYTYYYNMSVIVHFLLVQKIIVVNSLYLAQCSQHSLLIRLCVL